MLLEVKNIYKDKKVRVSGQELLDMFREVDENDEPEHEIVRLEINEVGDYCFKDDDCDEDYDTIYTQTYERSEWLENANDEVDMECWVHALNEFYHNNPIEIDTEHYTKRNEEGKEEYIIEYKRLLIVFY